ncbi:MAG: LacI family DNA-binding transcriptional regulator [Spirochaetes bacterium]|nr:LacI family DNA-binding transcriptional regulator [Spirochaetota bacterium]
MNKRLNIAEVAKAAGVSTATVSRVLNEKPFVRENTRRKVLRVIDKTNYRVNAVARNLRRKKTHSIGIIISNVLSPFYSVIAKAVEDVALCNNFSMVLCNGGDKPKKERRYLQVLFENRVDGIIISPTGENADYLKLLLSSGIAVCLIDRKVSGMVCDSVMVNNREASKEAVAHLLERGYRRIGLISGPKERTTGYLRMAGYLDAHKEYGIPPQERFIRYGDFSLESGRKNAALLLCESDLDALYVANTDMAMGAYGLLKERGVVIPDDMGFVMFDDPDWTRLVTPKLTAVSQPVYELGSTAAKMLFRRLQMPPDYVKTDTVQTVLNAKLVRRGSV